MFVKCDDGALAYLGGAIFSVWPDLFLESTPDSSLAKMLALASHYHVTHLLRGEKAHASASTSSAAAAPASSSTKGRGRALHKGKDADCINAVGGLDGALHPLFVAVFDAAAPPPAAAASSSAAAAPAALKPAKGQLVALLGQESDGGGDSDSDEGVLEEVGPFHGVRVYKQYEAAAVCFVYVQL